MNKGINMTSNQNISIMPFAPKTGREATARGSTNGAQKNFSSLIAVKSVMKRNPWDEHIPDHQAEAGS